MTAASGTTMVPETVRGSTRTAMTTTMTIGTNRAAREVVLRASARATVTVVTIVALAFNPRSATDRRDSAHGMRAGAVTMVIAAAARRSGESHAVSCTMTSADRIVMHGGMKRRSAADRRRLRRATDADRLVEARRPSCSAVDRTGGQASAAMEGAARSPSVVVTASAASVAMASAAGMTALALALDRSRTAVDLPPLAGDREAADAVPATTTMTLAVDAGGVTATDELSYRSRSVISI
jgi:hypothetical protein